MEKTNYKTYVQNSNQTEWSFLEDDKLLQIDFKSFTACTKYMKKELSENLFMTDNAINQIYCVNKETGQKYNFKK